VDNKCISHNSIILAICVPKIVKFGGDLIKFWQKNLGHFLDYPTFSTISGIKHNEIIHWSI